MIVLGFVYQMMRGEDFLSFALLEPLAWILAGALFFLPTLFLRRVIVTHVLQENHSGTGRRNLVKKNEYHDTLSSRKDKREPFSCGAKNIASVALKKVKFIKAVYPRDTYQLTIKQDTECEPDGVFYIHTETKNEGIAVGFLSNIKRRMHHV
ncbi:hypothetical protein [Bartonella sp. ML70XJBT.G]|uniref:hypothetical protein n=1 Tax=Bartonella sp. ML70XJBT.G TaxID=3019093 RepID=UPI002361F5B2|nr:hypothetical protein [Bartonella sp. ML70XJBT.G]